MHRHPVLPSRIRPATLSGLRLLGALALLLAFLVPGVSPVLAAGTLDQQQTDTAGGNVQCFGPPAALGQTFTAGLTGNVDQVDLFISVGAPSVINVQIRNVVGGVVGPTVLASTTASPPVAFAPTAFFSIPIPGGAPVVAGTQYAIVFDCPVPVIIALFSTAPLRNSWTPV
jgi:hypothetical protein